MNQLPPFNLHDADEAARRHRRFDVAAHISARTRPCRELDAHIVEAYGYLVLREPTRANRLGWRRWEHREDGRHRWVSLPAASSDPTFWLDVAERNNLPLALMHTAGTDHGGFTRGWTAGFAPIKAGGLGFWTHEEPALACALAFLTSDREFNFLRSY